MTQTVRTANFINSLGVNTHLYVTSGLNWDGGAVLDDLKYLGISNVRDETVLSTNQGQGSYALLAANGIKFDLIVPGSTNISTDLTQINSFLNANPGSVSAIEGPNEIDVTPVAYGGLTGTAAAVLFQSNLYSAVKADSALSGAAIYNFTDGSVAGQADYANIHVYPSQGAQPYATLTHLLQVQQGIMAKPAVVTETGYSTADTSSGLGGVDETTQAKLTLNTLMDATKLGVGEIFLYELFDDSDPSNTNIQAHYGLFDSTGAAKPVAVALHNLTSILADAGSTASTFATGTLNYTLTGAPTGSSSLLMEKSSGVYDIVLWNEPQIWNATTRTEVAAAATQTTINLGATYGTVDVYDPLVGTAPISEVHNASSVQVALTDHPLIIQVSSASSAPAVANAAVTSSAPHVLYGGSAGHQVLDDSVGAHTLDSYGGANDTFLVSHSDDVVIATAGSPNFVSSSVSFKTPANVSILTFTGSANVTGTGNGAGDILVGNSGADILYAAATGTDTLDGGSGPTTMYGGAGTTYFNAGAGVDTMYGGTGSNTYTINNTADVVVAKAGAALNNLYSSVSYTAPANVTYLAFTGSANVTGIGNGGNDTLRGNSGTDILYAAATGTDHLTAGAGPATMYGGAGTTYFTAGTGADTMYGGTGTNIFTINNTADVVVAKAGAVLNNIYSSVSYTAPANVTYLAFTGSANVTGTGNGGNDSLLGNSGNDVLYAAATGTDHLTGGAGQATMYGGAGTTYFTAGTGVDTMYGGTGTNIFTINNTADVVVAKAGAVLNNLYSSVSYTAPANVTYLAFTGSANVTGIGNGGNDTLRGNSGNDILYAAATGTDHLTGGAGQATMYGGAGTTYFTAGTGVDTMYGGTGTNIFTVNNTADVVVTHAGSVLNNLYSSVSYTAPANVTYMAFTGSAAVTGTANNGAMMMAANNAGDTLIGGAGKVIMLGGTGNDTFILGSGGGYVTGGGGADTFVFSSIASTGTLSSPSTISDFSSADHDHIDLRTLEASVLGANHSFHFIGAAAFSHTAGELHYTVSNGSLLLSGDINGDGVADFSISLYHVTSLSANDLIL